MARVRPEWLSGTLNLARLWLTDGKRPGKFCRTRQVRPRPRHRPESLPRKTIVFSVPCAIAGAGTAFARGFVGPNFLGSKMTRTFRTALAATLLFAGAASSALVSSAHATSRIKDLANVEG